MIFAPSCEYNYFKIKGSNKQTTANIILNSDRMLSSVLSTLHPFFFFFLMLQATHCYRENEVWMLYYLQLHMRKLRLGKVT